ncbi:MAG: carboxypeptidase-like regulatory domain-containing protein [Terracidiphilus sp.]
MKLDRVLFAGALVLVGLGGRVMGQAGGGSVVGSIHDPSGAVVPKAEIILTSGETGLAQSTRSSASGEYVFPLVEVGTYSLSVSAPGFEHLVQENLVVGLNKTVTADETLRVGSASATVEVQELATQLETTTSQAATTIDQQTFDDLPIPMTGAARSVTSVADLMPGVADTAAIGYGSTGPQGQEFSTTISGGQAWGGAVMYDGIPFISANQEADYRVQAVPVEALQEFSLVQNNFSAEYGRTPGGNLTYTTRPGTSSFHGQAYEYLRNTDLDAAGYFASSPTITHQNEFGLNIGGPVKIPFVHGMKDKLYFFGFYSGFRLAGGVTPSLTTIPTIAERSGDFSALGRNIYDPLTTTCNSAGTCTRQQYQYNGKMNVIPPSEISVVGQQYVKFLPQPINGNITNNYRTTGINDVRENRSGGRIDYNINDKNLLHGFFSTGPIDTADYNSIFLAPIATYGASIADNYQALARLGYDHTFGPALVMHLGYGWNYETESSTAPYSGNIDTFGIPNALPITPQFYCNPSVCPYASTGGGGGSTNSENSYIQSGFISWTRGRNEMKMGAEYDEIEGNLKNLDSIVDAMNSSETAFPGNNTSGDGFASLMGGAFDAVQQSDSPFGAENRFRYFDTYFEDNWKVHPRLTLNLGMRYDIPFTLSVHNSVNGVHVSSSFEPNLPNPGAGNIPGAIIYQGDGPNTCNCDRLADTNYKLAQPRAGLAYMLDNKTVIHAGYGIYISIDGASNGFGIIADGFNANVQTTSPNNGITPAMLVQNGYPKFTPPPFISPTYDNFSGTNWTPKNSGLPGVINDFTLDIQHQLPGGLLLDIGYIGNTAQHIASALVNPEQLPISDIAKYGNAVLGSPYSASTGIPLPFANFVADLGGNATNAQALKEFPQYTGINDQKQNTGHSSYNSLQARLQRHFQSGFSLLTSFTYAKQMTNAEVVVGPFNDGPQDAYSHIGEYSNAFDQPPLTLTISYNYDLPFGYQRKFLNHGILASLAGGWGVAGIHHYQSGVSMFETYVTNTLNIGNDDLRPDFVPGVPEKAHWTGKFNPATDLYINPAAFTAPPPNQFGNVPRNLPLRSFAYYDEDLSVRKDFHVWESAKMQFRSDWFNAFNRTDFASIFTGASNPQQANSGFGQVPSQGNVPRTIQFSLKAYF